MLVPLGISTLALIVGAALLLLTLSTDTHATNLLRSAALLWFFNILIFALWYWELDGGGPWKRHRSGHHAADFLFPQQAHGKTHLLFLGPEALLKSSQIHLSFFSGAFHLARLCYSYLLNRSMMKQAVRPSGGSEWGNSHSSLSGSASGGHG